MDRNIWVQRLWLKQWSEYKAAKTLSISYPYFIHWLDVSMKHGWYREKTLDILETLVMSMEADTNGKGDYCLTSHGFKVLVAIEHKLGI